MKTIEQNGKVMEVIDQRRGCKTDDNGIVSQTHNLQAGIGYELDDNDKRTGKMFAWASDNGTMSEMQAVESDSLDDYLQKWDEEWIAEFKNEGLI